MRLEHYLKRNKIRNQIAYINFYYPSIATKGFSNGTRMQSLYLVFIPTHKNNYLFITTQKRTETNCLENVSKAIVQVLQLTLNSE